jgi:HD-GYP domain-containing protein (c-di-GMP phosphodiesterase class II)
VSGKRIKIDVIDAAVGMFVAQLDRPWLETPFIFQGFELREDSEIVVLRKHCQHVYVDLKRSSMSETDFQNHCRKSDVLALAAVETQKRAHKSKPIGLMRRLAKKLAALNPASRVSRKPDGVLTYRNKASIQKEAPHAASSYNDAVKIMSNVLSQIRDGREVDVDTVRTAATPMIDSVLRNPDAMSWFVTLQKCDDYSYHHSIATSVWAVVLGRHLGFDRKSLDTLAIGGMLLDIGKTRIPEELLQKPARLSVHEAELIRQHVDFSLDMVRSSSGISRDSLDMIESHHERYDGSGYPRALTGADIPVYGRIAGIVDCYEAMVTPRPYQKARSSYDAVREINRLSGVLFQKELVEQFVQALGIFPTGSLVELNSGEVGIVVEQNRVRRLRPKVMLLLDACKQPILKNHTVDLRKLPSDTRSADAVWIIYGLETGAYGLNPQDYFM